MTSSDPKLCLISAEIRQSKEIFVRSLLEKKPTSFPRLFFFLPSNLLNLPLLRPFLPLPTIPNDKLLYSSYLSAYISYAYVLRILHFILESLEWMISFPILNNNLLLIADNVRRQKLIALPEEQSRHNYRESSKICWNPVRAYPPKIVGDLVTIRLR